jgi:hypothetical protein
LREEVELEKSELVEELLEEVPLLEEYLAKESYAEYFKRQAHKTLETESSV